MFKTNCPKKQIVTNATDGVIPAIKQLCREKDFNDPIIIHKRYTNENYQGF